MIKEYIKWSDGQEKKFLEEQGYSNISLKNGKWCGMYKYMFSTAILSDLNEFSFEERWCYHNPEVALAEYNKWDGTGEPQYWHRAIPSMRRRDKDNNDLGEW